MKNITLLGIILFIFSCKKSDSPKIDVSVITRTDVLGNLLGAADPTDWTLDQNWSAEEEALFQTPTADQLANSEKADVMQGPAFPNPLNTDTRLEVSTSKVTFMQIVITDDRLNIKEQFSFPTTGIPQNISLRPQGDRYANNTNYRMYYVYRTLADGIYAKGHGDIRIER